MEGKQNVTRRMKAERFGVDSACKSGLDHFPKLKDYGFMSVSFGTSIGQDLGEGTTRAGSTQGKIRKCLPTRPKEKAIVLPCSTLFFLKIRHCCSMVQSIIREKQHKPDSCHKEKTVSQFIYVFPPTLNSYLEGHTCSYTECLHRRLHQFSSLMTNGTKHFPVSSPRSNSCLLFLISTLHDQTTT